jgi:hypothetical protein
MLDDVGLELRGAVADLSVRIGGGWSSRAGREWVGAAVAAEPLVAIVLLASGGTLRWARTDGRTRDAPELPLRLSLLAYDAAGQDVQVSFAVGGAALRDRCLVASADYRPTVADQAAARTGRVVWLATVEGQGPLRLGALFLARRDATFARKGIWHLRPPLAARLDGRTAGLLTRGRTGEWR